MPIASTATYSNDALVKHLVVLGIKVLVIPTAHHSTETSINGWKPNTTIAVAPCRLKEPWSKIIQRGDHCGRRRLASSRLI